jgi:hypothetical protein
MKSFDFPRSETSSVVPPVSVAWQSRRLWFELAFSLWIVGAQIWYFLQFKDQFLSIFRTALRPLWH